VHTFVDIFVDEIFVERDYWNGCMFSKVQFYEKHYRKWLAEKL
jgi:hypothetical protein